MKVRASVRKALRKESKGQNKKVIDIDDSGSEIISMQSYSKTNTLHSELGSFKGGLHSKTQTVASDRVQVINDSASSAAGASGAKLKSLDLERVAATR